MPTAYTLRGDVVVFFRGACLDPARAFGAGVRDFAAICRMGIWRSFACLLFKGEEGGLPMPFTGRTVCEASSAISWRAGPDCRKETRR
jgi:hypothetical protein